MAQRYSTPTDRGRMANGLCPECGESSREHIDDPRFWIPRRCDLTPAGVVDRINQYERPIAPPSKG
jgi:hypothetical protein